MEGCIHICLPLYESARLKAAIAHPRRANFLFVLFLPVEGHDSSEDARACMELMIWKIKEDAKVKR